MVGQWVLLRRTHDTHTTRKYVPTFFLILPQICKTLENKELLEALDIKTLWSLYDFRHWSLGICSTGRMELTELWSILDTWPPAGSLLKWGRNRHTNHQIMWRALHREYLLYSRGGSFHPSQLQHSTRKHSYHSYIFRWLEQIPIKIHIETNTMIRYILWQ